MCGRFTLTARQLSDVTDLLQAVADPQAITSFRSRYNIAPSDTHWIFRPREQSIALEPAKWGLKPKWLKREEGFINARAETIAEKPAFRDAYRKRRCVIPADGFYEWKKEGKGKIPFWFHYPDRRVFLFAGLFEDPVEEGPPTFAILTRPAAGVAAKIHDRMPVILDSEKARSWMIAPHPPMTAEEWGETGLETNEVSSRVNSPRNDDPSLLNL